MRDIKFRAWVTDYKGKNGKMYYSGDDNWKWNFHGRKSTLCITLDGRLFATETHNAYKTDIVFISGKVVELMQYTGLKDKNGKEIYEGDIIFDCDVIKWCDKCIGEQVFWGDVCHNCDGDYSLGEIVSEIDLTKITEEVIGNIYENPELFN